ncbi:hypothetical protein H6P81_000621 [Aristolochia fimbriata]|uniref:Uncharacterized protein n=1 Tax=Aristolochia fimbriata TaxID=158543 RepID=A0AAV7F4Y3_ARIFI|nr:hypothetical protein H6P81_000621 [Aristolochia fimbriata]
MKFLSKQANEAVRQKERRRRKEEERKQVSGAHVVTRVKGVGPAKGQEREKRKSGSEKDGTDPVGPDEAGEGGRGRLGKVGPACGVPTFGKGEGALERGGGGFWTGAEEAGPGEREGTDVGSHREDPTVTLNNFLVFGFFFEYGTLAGKVGYCGIMRVASAGMNCVNLLKQILTANFLLFCQEYKKGPKYEVLSTANSFDRSGKEKEKRRRSETGQGEGYFLHLIISTSIMQNLT